MQGDADATISYKNMTESIKEWTNVLGLDTIPDSTAKITSSASGSSYTYNCKFWKNECNYIVLESWFAVGQPHSMKYEEDAILKFFGLDVAGGMDPELAKGCDRTSFSAGSTNMAHTHFFVKENALVLNSIRADEVSVTIVNTLGQIQYNGNYKIGSNVASLSIPLSTLRSGYYISSAVFYEDDKRIDSYNFHFALNK